MNKLSESKTSRRLILLLGNAILVLLTLFLCVQHVNTTRAEEKENAEASFVTNVSSLRSLATTVLNAEQSACEDWAVYLNANPMSMEEALEYLSESNSDSEIMAHILDYDTYTGYSATLSSAGKNTVDYSSFKSALEEQANYVQSTNDTSNLHLSASYTNPITAQMAAGFLEDIILEDNGGQKHYLLVRVVSAQSLAEKWTFPHQYSNAELALISKDGDYIIRTPSLKNENIWEFVRINNEIGYDEAENIKNCFYNGGIEIMELKDSTGQDCYLSCIPFAEDNDSMYYAAYIPASSLTISDTDLSLVFIVAAGLILILLLNSLYILDMNRKLRISNELALEASRAKTDFLSSMSHDIRTPMNAIIGLTTIASKNADDPVRVQDCISKINIAGNHLLTLINDILDISKIESGKLSLTPAKFSFANLITEELNIVQSQIRDKNQELEIHLHSMEYEDFYADELRLNQIFINLLSNAIKYTPEGGKICIDITEAKNSGNSVHLTYRIEDNGIGMSQEFLKVMFEPFSRMSDSRHDQTQGTGLGLTITKRMVDLMNGTIQCESARGEGTVFTVNLDLDLADKQTELSALPALNILIADDDPQFLATSLDLFDSLGLSPDSAGSIEEVQAKADALHAENKTYDAVFLDWKMNGSTCEKLIPHLRTLFGGSLPIIVMSAYNWSEIEDAAGNAGASRFQNKPLFRSTIHKLLENTLHLEAGNASEEEDITLGLHDLNLLVAEDNDMNWEIIHELLAMYGMRAERAVNGQICIDKLMEKEAGTYDAILMDIHMPVMDGLEATRRIRVMEDEAKRNIPIIAMTADAFAEDVQICIEAGMNGHTAKPVNMKKLFIALKQAL